MSESGEPKEPADPTVDFDAGMSTAERRLRKRRRGTGGVPRPSSETSQRDSGSSVSPLPNEPSLAASIAYSFGSETSHQAQVAAQVAARSAPASATFADPVAPESVSTFIDPPSGRTGEPESFETKTREMSAVDLNALGLTEPSDDSPNTLPMQRVSSPASSIPTARATASASLSTSLSGETRRLPGTASVPSPWTRAQVPIAERVTEPSILVAPHASEPAMAAVSPDEEAVQAPAYRGGLPRPGTLSASPPPVALIASADQLTTVPGMTLPEGIGQPAPTPHASVNAKPRIPEPTPMVDADLDELVDGGGAGVGSQAPAVDTESGEIEVDIGGQDEAEDDDAAEVDAADVADDEAEDDGTVVPGKPSGPPITPPQRSNSPAIAHVGTPSSDAIPLVPPPPPPAATKPPPAPAVKQAVAAKAAPVADVMTQRKSGKLRPWFAEVFDEDYLRTLPFLTPQATQQEAEFVAEALALAPGSQVLDVGCGYGRHAMELAARGYHVVGLDLSTPLLVRGGAESTRRGLSINFVCGDMRDIDFDEQFDGAYCLFSTFGYFDEEANRKTASNICRALKPGKRAVFEILNRDYITTDLPTRMWWEGDGCVVLEEVDFNYFSSRIQVNRSVVFDDGRQLEQEISMRAYSLHEIGKLLQNAGFRVLEVSGGYHMRGRFFGGQSRHIIIVAERRDDGLPGMGSAR